MQKLSLICQVVVVIKKLFTNPINIAWRALLNKIFVLQLNYWNLHTGKVHTVIQQNT